MDRSRFLPGDTGRTLRLPVIRGLLAMLYLLLAGRGESDSEILLCNYQQRLAKTLGIVALRNRLVHHCGSAAGT